MTLNVVLPGTDVQSALIIAERMGNRVADSAVLHEGTPIRITVSIGIADLRPGDERPENALARADNALYQAKHAGRNCVIVSDSPA